MCINVQPCSLRKRGYVINRLQVALLPTTMTAEPESAAAAATAAATDERQPLLENGAKPAGSRSSSRSTRSAGQVEAGGHEDEEQRLIDATLKDINESESWSAGQKIFYAILAVFVIALLWIFIQGFSDPDDVDFDLKKALLAALGGGLSGAAAMVLQVLTLMPLRTVMNYQYRYGTSTSVAIRTLYNDGGYPRYYHGLAAALIQGPLARFGDTAANAGILVLLQSNRYLKDLPIIIKTVFASLAAAAFRMVLTPIDTVKTTMQTQGSKGLAILRARIRKYGIGTMWYGAFATAAATFVGHYPWFATYNYLDANLPQANTLATKLLRRAFIGFVASIASDTISNSLRVLKTYRQVNETKIGYVDAAKAVVAKDGVKGLFGRGLKTRIITNGLQGIMFSVLWRLFLDIWNEKTK